MKKILSVITLLLFPVIASATEYVAASCEKTAVDAAIASATSPGDIVTIPAGTCTWSSAVTLTNKAITLQGQSATSPTITGKLVVNNALGYTVTVRDFKITGPGGAAATSALVGVKGGVADFRITGMTIEHTSSYAMVIEGDTFGVVDNNTFTSSTGASAIYVNGPGSATAYARASRLGTDDMVYVENNTLSRNTYAGGTHVIWGQNGSSYVFRYNTVTNYEVDVHGDCTGPGAREYEIYENDFIIGSGSSYSAFAVIRGGTGVVYNNTVTNNGTKPSSSVGVQIREQQVDQGTLCTSGGGYCAACDYPASHQLGRGQSDALDPVYVWGNVVDGSSQNTVGIWPITGDTTCESASYCNKDLVPADYMVVNRDYYVGSARPGYTAYTYPHPLTGGSAPPDNTPAGFSFVDNVDVPINSMIYSAPMSPAVSAIDNICSIAISGTGCEYAVNGGSWATAEDNVALNDNVSLRVMSSPNYSTDKACTLILGGSVSDTWHATTIAAQAVNYVPFPPRMRAHLRQSPTGYTPPADPGYVGHIYPTGATSTSESPYSNNAWTNPAFVHDAGEASITAATFDAGDRSYILKGFAFDFSAVPVGATINGVEVKVVARYAVAPVSIALAQLLDTSRAKVGTNLAATPVDLSTSSVEYTFGGAANLWGNALTAAWVKDADFGIALGFLAGGSGNSNNDVFVDSVTMKVWYTP